MESKCKRRRWPWVVAALFLLAYPLSAGPTYWLISHKYLPLSVWKIYHPLFFGLIQKSETLIEGWRSYLHLWVADD